MATQPTVTVRARMGLRFRCGMFVAKHFPLPLGWRCAIAQWAVRGVKMRCNDGRWTKVAPHALVYVDEEGTR